MSVLPASSEQRDSPPRPRARSLLFDLYGGFVDLERQGEGLRLGAIVRLAGQLGASEAAVRSAVQRMVQDGWLVAERHGRETACRLSEPGRALIEQGRRRILASPDEPWDGAWCLVALSVPETQRELRDRMRKKLSWLGFGSPSSALYLSGRDHTAEVLRLAAEAEASAYVQVYRAAALWPGEPRELVARAWGNLAAVEARYQEFLTRFGPLLPRVRASASAGTLDELDAFRLRFSLGNQLRKCLYDDPDLPADLLPPGWSGSPARRLFLELYGLVEQPALRYFRRVCQAASG